MISLFWASVCPTIKWVHIGLLHRYPQGGTVMRRVLGGWRWLSILCDTPPAQQKLPIHQLYYWRPWKVSFAGNKKVIWHLKKNLKGIILNAACMGILGLTQQLQRKTCLLFKVKGAFGDWLCPAHQRRGGPAMNVPDSPATCAPPQTSAGSPAACMRSRRRFSQSTWTVHGQGVAKAGKQQTHLWNLGIREAWQKPSQVPRPPSYPKAE